MTGFARAGGQDERWTWSWELRSVNGRGLEVRLRLPAGLEGLDQPARAAITAILKRGNVAANLTAARLAGDVAIQVNRAALDRYLSLVAELQPSLPEGVAPARLDGMLALKGVVEVAEPAEPDAVREARDAAMLASLERALGELGQARLEEGARLAGVLGQILDEVETLVAAARGNAATQPEAIKARLAEKLAALLDGSSALAPERLAQEAALLATKADVREELDRLTAHLGQARDLLKRGDAKQGIGRRFDFLAQEFNREANTLCSKSADVGLTRIGLDLKTAIDRLREQVQNIE
jgi:uncharacterized protein (TIGR00255 family)